MKEAFTSERRQFRAGLFSLAFFLAMLVIGILAMSDVPPDRRAVAMLVVGLLMSFFVGLSAWVLLDYFRSSVTLDDEVVLVKGVLRERTVTLSEVSRARWRRPHISLKLFWPGGRMVLWFEGLRPDHRRRLIHYFRERLNPEVQEGWGNIWNGTPPRWRRRSPRPKTPSSSASCAGL